MLENVCTGVVPEFFAAANSGRGFVSFYGEIFNTDKIKRRFLIKGGPGTGKSTLMRRIAESACRKGDQVCLYRCSSDPSSLDGVIINGEVAVIDSTAPHTVEPELVGARDSIVDLGAFWDVSRLSAERERISALTDEKKRAYSLAYRFLASSMQCDIASRELLRPYVDFARIKRTARRLTRDIPRDSSYERHVGLLSAIGMNGRYSLDTYRHLAKRVILIEAHYGLENLLLSELCAFAFENQNKISVSYRPLCPELPDVVYFEREGVAFLIAPPRTKGAISLARALDLSLFSKNERTLLKARARSAENTSSSLVDSAILELSFAGKAHFELEKIYSSAMDFSRLEGVGVSLC